VRPHWRHCDEQGIGDALVVVTGIIAIAIVIVTIIVERMQ